VTGSHHRRRSSTSAPPSRLHQQSPAREARDQGSTSGLSAGRFSRAPLPTIPGTPADPSQTPMSLSRSPSPLPGGGWSSPGLNAGSGSTSPQFPHGPTGPSGISWASAKAKSDEVRSYPSFSTRNSGFFSRQKRKISASLPRFTLSQSRDYREKEKLGRGRWQSGGHTWKGRLVSFGGSLLRRSRYRFLLIILVVFICYLSFWNGRSSQAGDFLHKAALYGVERN
jgi:mannan polymerase II complex MNN10 subunit